MRTVFVAAISCLFVTFITSVSSAQERNQPDRQLLASSLSLQPADPQPPANGALDALFNPVPLEAIPASPGAAGCVAPAGSPTVPPAPVASTAPAPAAPEPALPNFDSAEPAAAASFVRVPIAPEPRHDSVQRFVFSNTAMYGATVFHAFGRAAEVEACKHEIPVKNGVYTAAPYKGQTPATLSKFYAIALPIDAGVTMLSAFARHRGWRAFEIAGPLSAASAHITAGAFKFSSGCY